ncbi:MAG TPA: DNA-3-methyladenine glycosylase [Vicinamibacterales bacterium]|nr:DNA-3-methyladenine glycosylase [Vicinamibacterales bacterium]
MTSEDYRRATRLLARRDPVIRDLIRRYGPCGMADAQRPDHFAAIVKSITAQQLSVKAAKTIYQRIAALCPDCAPTPGALACVTDEQLRAAGLSRQKIVYVRDLSAKVLDGTLPLDALDAMDDEAAIEAITRVKGLGRWSAEMFLMFRLHRPDVMPVDDLGIVNAMTRAYRLRKKPKPKRLLQISEAWRPYRSVACWYLWRSLENT